MGALEVVILVIIGIVVLVGVLTAGAIVFALHWLFLPIIGALIGGWLGFFFGVGLSVIIMIIGAATNNDDY